MRNEPPLIAKRVTETATWFNVKSGNSFNINNIIQDCILVHQTAIVNLKRSILGRGINKGLTVRLDVINDNDLSVAANVDFHIEPRYEITCTALKRSRKQLHQTVSNLHMA